MDSGNRIFYQMLIQTTSQNPQGEDVEIPAGTVLFYDPDDKKVDVSKIMAMIVAGEARLLTKDEVLAAMKRQVSAPEGNA